MSDDIGAVFKLTTTTALGPPGPMIGFHGRLRPDLKPDPALKLALDQALATVVTRLQLLAPANPGLPKTLDAFSFAVVDLSDDPRIPGFGRATPAYAGVNDTRMIAIGSLAKLLPLYAAHQLRSDARALASVAAPASIGALGDLLRSHHRRMGAADDTFPLIEDMFTIDGNGLVDFKTGGTRWPGAIGLITDLQLKQLDADDHAQSARLVAIKGKLRDRAPRTLKVSTLRDQLAQVAFREQLRLMAGWSSNVSASIVIHAIGFPYLWKLANRSGLFRSKGWERLVDPRRGTFEHPGGLFLGQDFAGHVWTDRPRSAPVFGRDASQAGNARTVAQLMTSLADELIDDEAHISMREMLRKGEQFGPPLNFRGEDSPIGVGMASLQAPQGWRAQQRSWFDSAIPGEGTPEREDLVRGELAASKIGRLSLRDDAGQGMVAASNALLVRAVRGNAATPITAVLVALGVSKDIDPFLLFIVLGLFGEAMAPKLDARHP